MAGMFEKLQTSTKVALGVIAFVIAILILWGAIKLAPMLPAIGQTATSTPLIVDSWIQKIITIVLGIAPNTPFTIEGIVLHGAIFVIILFALSEMVELFFTFSSVTSWVIGLCLALVASVTKINSLIAAMFGLTAGIGALGVAIIILGAIFAAVTLSLGIGPLRKWRMQRQIEIESFKSEKGASRVSSAIKGLKEVEESFADKEKP